MAAIQHIVAGCATPFCNNPALRVSGVLRHNVAVSDIQESNAGPNHLRAWREYRGLSQEELAERIGSSHQVIGYLERGRTQLSAKWLRKLAPALKTTPGHLLDHDPSEMPADIIDIWSRMDTRGQRQLRDIARTLTGTED